MSPANTGRPATEPRTEAGIDWPQSWTADDIAWVKRQILAEATQGKEERAAQSHNSGHQHVWRCDYCEALPEGARGAAPQACICVPNGVECDLTCKCPDHFGPDGAAPRAEGPSRAKLRYDAISAANDKWPNATRHSTTLRRGFIEGYVTALAAPRAEGRRVCWSCEGEHDEMKHSLAAPRAEGHNHKGNAGCFQSSCPAYGAAPRAEGLEWPDPKAMANALYREYNYTVTPEDVRNAYARLSRPSDERNTN